LQSRSSILINSLLLFINKSIFTVGTPISLPLYLFISSLKQNLKRGFLINYLEIKGLKIQLIFNKNIIKPKDNKKYIKETVNTIVILYAKQRYNYKDNVLIYLKASLSRTIKIKPTKIIKLLYN